MLPERIPHQQLSRPTGGPPFLLFCSSSPNRAVSLLKASSFNSSTILLLSWNCSAKPDRKAIFFTPHKLGMHRKNKNGNCCFCTRALLLVKCTRPHTVSILLSRLALSLSIRSPLLPHPSSSVRPILPLSLLYLFGICQTNTSPMPHSPLPPPLLPTPRPHLASIPSGATLHPPSV